MRKKIVFLVIHLNLLKSLANGFVIGGNDMINQWLQPFNAHQNQEETAETSLTRNEGSELNPKNVSGMRSAINEDTPGPLTMNEGSELNPKNASEMRSAMTMNEEKPVPISHVLETLQTQINEADNVEKKYYKKLLTEIEQMFTQKSRYAQVFFNHTRHIVDLGLYGSSQRTRDASTVSSMLKSMRDAIKWVFKSIFDLLPWNIATDKDENDDNEPPGYKGKGIKVNTKVGEKGEHIHKITHKFEIDPFVIKLNMDITCRILDDSKNPNHSHTSSSHHKGEHEASQGEEKQEDDWDYPSFKKTPKPDQKDTPEFGSATPDVKDKPSADGKTPVSSSPNNGANPKPKKSLKAWITGQKPS